MAIGPVNVPGSVGTDLLEVQKNANEAIEKSTNNEIEINKIKAVSDEALSTAHEAKNIANEALIASGNAQTAADAALKATTKLTSVINALPTQNGTLTYSGEELSPKWNSYDDTKLTIGGDTTATNAGTYTATFTPKDGYMWNDETTEAKSVIWAINRASIAVPSQRGSLAYTGSAQSPTWSGYDSNKMTVSGTTSGINVSNYTAIFTPKDNYQWSDGTISDKIVTWSIGKTAGSLSLSKTSVTLDASVLTTTVSVTRAGDGTITAISGNTGIATVSVSGTVLTITAKYNGTTTITVRVSEGTNHTSPSYKTINVVVDLPSKTLNDNTPEQIQRITRTGNAPNYWSVGDRIGIKLNGTVKALTFNNETYYAFILGFNHNVSIENANTNSNYNIHFQFGKTSDGIDIAFVDEYMGSDNRTTGFSMRSTTSGNAGNGWINTVIRKETCPAFLRVMPTAWQNIVISCQKYTDNVGDGGSVASYVTATSDKIWLLSEFEVWGNIERSNDTERNYQQQYAYYANGNSKAKYSHKSTNFCISWWLRSLDVTNRPRFCVISSTDVNVQISMSYEVSAGFAPCFAVA